MADNEEMRSILGWFKSKFPWRKKKSPGQPQAKPDDLATGSPAADAGAPSIPDAPDAGSPDDAADAGTAFPTASNASNKQKAAGRTGLEKTGADVITNAFTRACYDLYVSNMPSPDIIGDKKGDAPGGFSINPENWKISFSTSSLPGAINTKESLFKYSRSIFHHELSHFTVLPANRIQEAVLVDSALKGFSKQYDSEAAKQMAHIVVNIVGDWVGDTLLAKEKYGREDFGDLTRWRTKETITDILGKKEPKSALWQAIIGYYEKQWNEDYGVSKNASQKATDAVNQCISIMGNDWQQNSTWEDKTRRIASVLEEIITETSKQSGGKGRGKGSGSGGGISMPNDVSEQMGGDPTQSSLKGKAGKLAEKRSSSDAQSKQRYSEDDKDGNGQNGAKAVDSRVLDEIFKRNSNDPSKFAGTMNALYTVDADQALRLMYRARAREFLIQIAPSMQKFSEDLPSYKTTWNIGDPTFGKSGLDVAGSMKAAGGILIPGVTTVKTKHDAKGKYGEVKGVADLIIYIDSSGSMGWDPHAADVESRGPFDKAILAAEASTLYALSKGAKVAVINYSAEENVLFQEFTDDIDLIEATLTKSFGGGTYFPIRKSEELLSKNTRGIVAALIGDCQVSNPQDAAASMKRATTQYDVIHLFKIGSGEEEFAKLLKQDSRVGETVVDKLNDLAQVMIGELSEHYEK